LAHEIYQREKVDDVMQFPISKTSLVFTAQEPTENNRNCAWREPIRN
jgi:hypothetical protein